MDACLKAGVTPLAYYPLAMGLLTGRPAREGGGRREKDLRESAVKVEPLAEVLREVGGRYGKTPAQVALNWVMCKGAVPIVGITRESHVDANLGSLGWRLKKEDVEVLERCSDELDFVFKGAGFQSTEAKFVGYGWEKWTLD